MARLVGVSKDRHGDKSWGRPGSFSFASGENLVPIVAAELSRAVSSMPLAFVRLREQYLLVGLLSLTPGRNLFVAPRGRWLGAYVPSAFRGVPFRLAKSEKQADLILCVDEESGLVYDDREAGERFFDEDGDISRPLKKVMDFLQNVEKNRMATEAAVSALDQAGVIVPWGLKIGGKKVEGLYRVDEAKLREAEDSIFLQLRKAGAFPIAYGQLLSMGNLFILKKLAAVRKKHDENRVPKPMAFNDGDFIRFDE